MNYKLIYFKGCPTYEGAKLAIKSAGIIDFEEYDQNALSSAHPYKKFSSPTILDGEEIVFGTNTGSSACSVGFKPEEIIKKLELRNAK